MIKKLIGKRKVLVAFLLAVLTLAVTFFAAPYTWWRVFGGQVTNNAHPCTGSAVYRSLDGRLLIAVREHDHSEFYIFDPHNIRAVGPTMCSTDSDEFYLSTVAAVSRDVPVPCEMMPGLEVLVEPNLTIHPRGVEFTSPSNERYSVLW